MLLIKSICRYIVGSCYKVWVRLKCILILAKVGVQIIFHVAPTKKWVGNIHLTQPAPTSLYWAYLSFAAEAAVGFLSKRPAKVNRRFSLGVVCWELCKSSVETGVELLRPSAISSGFESSTSSEGFDVPIGRGNKSLTFLMNWPTGGALCSKLCFVYISNPAKLT